jgi:peptidoglycan biosynthesis protein MviN/MurJ (putative lipid II flippase)
VYLLLAACSVVEILFLAATVLWPLHISSAPAPPTANAALSMLVMLTLLAFIPPMERVLTALRAPADAARYDYAIRSLRSGQQLLVGGLFLASLGDWSSLASAGARVRLQRSLVTLTGVATLLLLLAASVALVAIHDIVRLVFEHGTFTAADTNAVATIVLLGLPGFVAESLVLVQSSALAALKRNDLLVVNGIVRFVGTALMLLLLAPRWGANGAAIAYSTNAVVSLVIVQVELHLLSLWPARGGAMLARYTPLAGATVGTAVLLYLLAGGAPPLFRAAIVGAVFLALLYRERPLHTLRALRV